MKFGLLALAIGLFGILELPAQSSQHEVKIKAIEKGLLPVIGIEGESSPTWSIQERMNHHNVPAVSIAFFDEGKSQWTKTYGYLTSDSLKAVDEQTMFQAASISKPVAGLGAMTLVEDGMLDLDKDVNQYLKDWQIEQGPWNSDEHVDFRNLITHTGGLTVHGFRGYASDEAVPTTIQVLNGDGPANSDPIVLDTFPNALWRYSGGGYTIAQKVMSDITGQEFHKIMEKRVLKALNMQRSTYEQPLPEKYHANAAVGYRSDGSRVKGNWHTYPEQAAAGLWTTPSDLARLAIAVQKAYVGQEGEIISPETAIKMLTKHQGDWGLGFGLSGAADSLRFGHGGANEGFRCNLFAFADLGQGVAIMTNGDNGSRLGSEVLRAISNAYDWGVYNQQIKKVVELSNDDLAPMEGTYVFTANEQFTITIDLNDGVLHIRQHWNGEEYPIFPESPSNFFAKTDGTPFEFVKNDNGTIKSVLADGGFELVKKEE